MNIMKVPSVASVASLAIAALLFSNQPGWAQTEVQKLIASDATALAEFGRSIDADAVTIVIGATPDISTGTGAVYVFESPTGTWVEVAKLTPSDGTAGDSFGDHIRLDGDRMIVGAPRHNSLGVDAGAAYVFERIGSTWTEVQKLTASDGAAGDFFGSTVELQGDLILVGSHLDDDQGSDSGSVYVFDRAGGVWGETAKLTASDGAAADHFGKELALDGQLALIGAPRDSTSAGSYAGSCYVFDRNLGSWLQKAKLNASDAAGHDAFGTSIDLEGEVAVIGAFRNDDQGSSSGSAYMFRRIAPGLWSEDQKLLPSDGDTGDWFGSSVAIKGSRLLIGAHKDEGSIIDIGASYVFENKCGSWEQESKIAASDGQAGDVFGGPAVLLEEGAVLAARGVDNFTGAAYTFGFDTPSSPTLTGCPESISVATGGTQAFALNAGTSHASKTYLLLGSASGTSPGIEINGEHLPLQVFDSYFLFTVNSLNQGPFQNTLGILSSTGTATASLTVPIGYPSLAGLTLHHAYVVFNPNQTVALASNATPLQLVP